MSMTSAERQRKRRKKLKDEGEKEILVKLDRHQQNAMHRLCARYGWNVSQAVGWALHNCLSKLEKLKENERLIVRANEQIFTRCEDGIYRACD